MLAISSGAVEGAVQQEVHELLAAGGQVGGLPQLLLDLEQLGPRPQHLVLGDTAVGIQRVVHAQVLLQQPEAGRHDLEAAPGPEPVQVADGDVALEPARERLAGVGRAVQRGPLGAERRRNRGRVERLAQRQPGVLLLVPQERETVVGDVGEARRLAIGDEEFVEGLVGRVDQVADGQVDLPPAVSP